MLQALDDACHRSSDPPTGPPPQVVWQVRTGRRGRPRIEFDPDFLSTALSLRGPTGVAPVVNTSSRTIRRRALDYMIVEPGNPVFQDIDNLDGTTTRVHTTTTRPLSTLTDEELDAVIRSILEQFPDYGQRMLAGALRVMHHRVPRQRLTSSYVRVHGTPGAFGDRQIHRKIYSVAGANSLWHHDGQHGKAIHRLCAIQTGSFSFPGLIRFKIVIHCFIDGKSRFIVGIRASNNNLATTVYKLFCEAMVEFGIPSRSRGDHGTENVLVAAWMEDYHGPGRGSYIWGR